MALVLIGVYPLLAVSGRVVAFFAVCVGTIPCVVFGRRRVPARRRLPWTLLLSALVVIVVANVVELVPDEPAVVVGWLLDALGNVLFLVAALALTLRRGFSQLGGIIDTTVIALAVGGVLWSVVPRELGGDRSLAAQANLFVVLFALTGVLGALLRLSYTVREPGTALPWLMAALGLGIGANAMLAIADDDPARNSAAQMLFMAAFAAIGLFGLDRTGPWLAHPTPAGDTERLSTQRLVGLGVAVALIPVAIGIRELAGGDVDGVLLAVQGVLVSSLVMLRIGLLSTQRDRAEQALVYQAAHDPVTTLANRREFVTRLRDELRRGSRCAVLFCDLNDFKGVNDRFGHSAGDLLLVEVANRIEACTTEPRVVSRFGGDEFVVLLINAAPAQVLQTRDCIIEAIARPVEQLGGVTIGVAVGAAFSDGAADPEDLIREADRAMYRAKPAKRS